MAEVPLEPPQPGEAVPASPATPRGLPPPFDAGAPPPAQPGPSEVRAKFDPEDWVSMGAALAVTLLAWFPPWGPNAQPLNTHRIEAFGLGLLGLLQVAVLLILRFREHTLLRRRSNLVGGVAGVALALAYSVSAYLAHQVAQPELGVVGHLTSGVGYGALAVLPLTLLIAWSGVRTLRAAHVPRPTPPVYEHTLPRSVRRLLPFLVFIVAFAHLSQQVEDPSIIDFDEAHYVRVALNMTDGVFIDPGWGTEHPRPSNFEHPPVGKYLVAAGILLYGQPHDDLDWGQLHELCNSDEPQCARDAASWRFGSVFAGALGVVGIYWIGLRLFRSLAAGVIAAALLLLDNLYFLHARIAMLDIFPIAFLLVAFGVVLGPRLAHRYVGSLMFGLAIASKFPAVFLLPPFFALVFLTSAHRDRWMRLREALILTLILPSAVYLVAYMPYWVHWFGAHGFIGGIDDFLYVHGEGFRWGYRAHVDKPHPYFSHPQTWLPMRMPVLYFVGYRDINPDPDVPDYVGHIYAVGNFFTWWTGTLLGLIALFLALPQHVETRARWGLRAFWDWWGRPFSFTPYTAFLFSALLFVFAYVPFFAIQRDQFNFYFVLACPFLSLILAGALGHLWDRRILPFRPLVVVAIALALAVFLFYYPISTGSYIPEKDFQHIINFLHCPDPPAKAWHLDDWRFVPCMDQDGTPV